MPGAVEATRTAAFDEMVLSLHALEQLIRQTHDAGLRVSSAFSAAAAIEGLPPLAGRQFIAEMARTNLHIADALNHSGDGHRLLRRLATSMGIDPAAYGDGKTDEGENTGGSHRASLQVA